MKAPWIERFYQFLCEWFGHRIVKEEYCTYCKRCSRLLKGTL